MRILSLLVVLVVTSAPASAQTIRKDLDLGLAKRVAAAAADEARRLKEKLAGLQAKVKTLTSL